MTIQKLSTVQNSGAYFYQEEPLQKILSGTTSSSSPSQIQTSPSQSSIEAPSSFGRTSPKAIEDLNYKQKPQLGSFADKLLSETTTEIKNTCRLWIVEGDQFFNQNRLDEAEKYYADALKAISGKDVIQEAICAEKLGMTYLKRAYQDNLAEDKKEECMKAAGLLNYGLLLAKNQNAQELQKELLEKLVEVDQALCSLCNAQFERDKGLSLDRKNRQNLDEIRKSTKDKLKSINRDPLEVEKLFDETRKSTEHKLDSLNRYPQLVEKLSKEITTEMKAFTAELIGQSIEVLGNPPSNCEFAVIGFGSMAREEMTPFSDLEFAILIEEGKDSEGVKQYFRDLTHLMHLRVLNLGETIVPILDIKSLEGFYDDVTPKGFAFDGKGPLGRGYKTPLGKKDVFELIQTPTKMAEFQGKNGEQYWYEHEPFLPTELHSVTLVYGEKSLVKSYMKELDTALNVESREGSTLKEHYAKKHLSEEDGLAFGANFGPAELGMLFELKKDLYRMPHLLIERLFLNECKSIIESDSITGTFSKINWLKDQKKISKEGFKNLNELLGKVFFLRLKNSYVTNSVTSKIDMLTMPSEDIDEKVCNISFSFCEAVKRNFRAQEPLHNDVFISTDPYFFAQIKARLGKYKEVDKYILDCLKEVPDHIDALMLSAIVSNILSKKGEAKDKSDKATKLIKGLGDDQVDTKIVYLANLGDIYQQIGEIRLGFELIEEVEKLIKDKPKFIELYVNISENLAASYIRRQDLIKAEEILEKNKLALENMKKQASPQRYTRALAAYNCNLSQLHLHQNHAYEAIKYAEKSLELFYTLYGKKHHQILETSAALGHLYCFSGAHEKGIQYLQETFHSSVEIFGEFHETSIERYLNLSHELNKIDPLKGMVSSDYLESAEKVETVNISFFHVIASAWERINQLDRAERVLLKSIKIAEEQKLSAYVAVSYHLLAKLCMNLGKDAEAVHHAELTLKENRKVYEDKLNQFSVIYLTNLAECKISQLYRGSIQDVNTQKESIIDHLKKAREMCIEISKTASTSNFLYKIDFNMGFFEWEINGDAQKAVDYFSSSLKNLEDLFGPKSIRLVDNLKFLGIVYSKLLDKEKSYYHLKKFLDLTGDHFGKSSQQYTNACEIFRLAMQQNQ